MNRLATGLLSVSHTITVRVNQVVRGKLKKGDVLTLRSR